MTAPLLATITYCLGESGRKASLKAWGSGAYHQNVSGIIVPDELPLFSCSPDGTISVVFNQMEFDEPQTFTDILQYLKERRERFLKIKVLMEAEAIAETAFEARG